ncbi:MAG: DUF2911 domain-containing protein [Gemmatimonadaceae bacterium]|nr:DUF2911 domain-containing protein [Gemmatimonadaceae bacterium]
MHLPGRTTLQALMVSVALSTPLTSSDAQIRASELQSIAQTVDGTTLRVTYSRPRLRGRTVVFGTKAVQWGEVWTPGANYATVLDVDRDVTMGGVAVPKGKYGIWMIVSRDSTWTMLLDPKWKQFHTEHPKPNDTQLRVPVRANPRAATTEEVLTFSFPSVSARGGTLAMQWARMRLTVPFQVTPTLSEKLPEAEARPYVGTYVLDSLGKAMGKLIVTYADGGLKARFDPNDGYFNTFALMRTGRNLFTVGLFEAAEVYAGGEIYEVLKPDLQLTFTLSGGSVTLEMRDDNDALWFSGKRAPER